MLDLVVEKMAVAETAVGHPFEGDSAVTVSFARCIDAVLKEHLVDTILFLLLRRLQLWERLLREICTAKGLARLRGLRQSRLT